MQKVIRRTILAEKQAARRLARRKERSEHQDVRSALEQFRFGKRTEAKEIKIARQVRREDWELGSLAPRRDVGLRKDTYGTVHGARLQLRELSSREMKKLRAPGAERISIVKGDRVVLLEGRDKGKIGEVESVDVKRQSLTVKGLNMADLAVPDWMMTAEGNTSAVRAMPTPVPLTKVKLVFPLKDPETGIKRDVIVRSIVTGKVTRDRDTRKESWKRYIKGLQIEIPWPPKPKVEHKIHDCDTLRLDVESYTFVPTLLKSPMPMSVIDELRNKYSVFRTRHDEEYIEKKKAEDEAAAAKKKSTSEMRTPLNELNRAARKLRKAKGIKKLTPVMLARIGEVIARRKAEGVARRKLFKVKAVQNAPVVVDV